MNGPAPVYVCETVLPGTFITPSPKSQTYAVMVEPVGTVDWLPSNITAWPCDGIVGMNVQMARGPTSPMATCSCAASLVPSESVTVSVRVYWPSAANACCTSVL